MYKSLLRQNCKGRESEFHFRQVSAKTNILPIVTALYFSPKIIKFFRLRHDPILYGIRFDGFYLVFQLISQLYL